MRSGDVRSSTENRDSDGHPGNSPAGGIIVSTTRRVNRPRSRGVAAGRQGVPSAAGKANTIELICPCCGRQDAYPVGAFTCNACGLEITVKISGYAKAAQPVPSWQA